MSLDRNKTNFGATATPYIDLYKADDERKIIDDILLLPLGQRIGKK